VTPPVTNTDEPKSTQKSAFAGLSFSAEFEGGGDDDEADGDNLMVYNLSLVLLSSLINFVGYVVQAMLQKRKDKKKDKKKQKAVDFDDGPPPGQGSDGEAAAAKGDISVPQKPKEMTAEELADEEFGPVKEKKGKKKKGSNKTKGEENGMCYVVESHKTTLLKSYVDDESKAVPETSEPKEAPTLSKSEPAPDVDDDDGDAGDGPKILSKKEKEKIKKEKERAKKKAQAAAKKAENATGGGGEDGAPAPAPAAGEGGDEDDGAEGAATSKKKKKKKKKKGEDEDEDEDKPAPAPAAKVAGKKGPGVQLAALRAMMEERKRLEEEARKQEEERRRSVPYTLLQGPVIEPSIQADRRRGA